MLLFLDSTLRLKFRLKFNFTYSSYLIWSLVFKSGKICLFTSYLVFTTIMLVTHILNVVLLLEEGALLLHCFSLLLRN